MPPPPPLLPLPVPLVGYRELGMQNLVSNPRQYHHHHHEKQNGAGVRLRLVLQLAWHEKPSSIRRQPSTLLMQPMQPKWAHHQSVRWLTVQQGLRIPWV